MSQYYLIVGLGNPGREYANTRHNVGFQCVDAFAQAHHLSFDSKKKSKAKVATGMAAERHVVIAKPQTYMNLSGTSVQGLATFFKIPPTRILVIYDDLDLPPGTLRIRPKGGSGGHKGMRSIIDALGSQAFPRLRVGIDRPLDRTDPADYVLQPFDEEQQSLAAAAIERATAAIECWLAEGIVAAMDRFNRPPATIDKTIQENQE